MTSRIIPARAGFTNPRSTYHLRLQDHPRSRGVYHRKSTGRRAKTGSSPLARGLHYYPVTVNENIRIIPARAGFTGVAVGDGTESMDHPRSRGVYPARRRLQARR